MGGAVDAIGLQTVSAEHFPVSPVHLAENVILGRTALPAVRMRGDMTEENTHNNERHRSQRAVARTNPITRAPGVSRQEWSNDWRGRAMRIGRERLLLLVERIHPASTALRDELRFTSRNACCAGTGENKLALAEDHAAERNCSSSALTETIAMPILSARRMTSSSSSKIVIPDSRARTRAPASRMV